MTEPRWHGEKDPDLRPKPDLYRLEAETDGEKWSLGAVTRTNRGSPRRKTLQLPKHDAETIKEILESLYGGGMDSHQGRRPMTEPADLRPAAGH